MKPKKLLLLALCASNLSCASQSNSSSPYSKMDQFYENLTVLLSDVLVEDRFKSTKDQNRIEDEIKNLRNLSHDLKFEQLREMQDPKMILASKSLRERLSDAYLDFHNNNKESARNEIRSIIPVCMSCHASSDRGLVYGQRNFDPEKLPFSRLELAEFYVSSRQFNKAQEIYLKIINDKDGPQKNYWSWTKAIGESLSLAIRTGAPPAVAEEILRAAIENPSVPVPFRRNVFAWKKSVDDWAREPVAETDAAQSLEKGDQLFSQAKHAQQFPSDRNANILYLRAEYYFYRTLRSGTVEETNVALSRLRECETAQNESKFGA